MGLDLRLPLGLMFFIIGLILLGYGLLTWGSGQYALSLGLNVNFGWGAVMLVRVGAMCPRQDHAVATCQIGEGINNDAFALGRQVLHRLR